MKKSAGILLLILLGLQSTFSQWVQKHIRTDATLMSVHFIDPDTGWVVGYIQSGGNLVGKLYKTSNVGNTWFEQDIGITGVLDDITFSDPNHGWIVGGDGSIFSTTDGGLDWNSQNSGTNQGLKAVYFVNNNTGWAAGLHGIILKTVDGGNHWISQVSPTDAIITDIFFIDTLQGWASTYTGKVMKTTDGGQNWDSRNTGVNYILDGIYFTNDNTGVAVGTMGTIVKTTDRGDTWSLIQSGTTSTLTSIFFTDGNTGWITGGSSYDNSGIILNTTNGGADWNVQYYGYSHYLFRSYFLNTNSGWAVGMSGTILHSTSGPNYPYLQIKLPWRGISWYSGNSYFIEWFDTFPENVRIVLYTSSSLEDQATKVLTIAPNTESDGSYLWAIPDTIQPGIYKIRISRITPRGLFDWSDRFSIMNYLETIKLYNYPNPFNPSTSIQYAISSRQFVTLKVYDILGNEIATLVNEEKHAGTYELTWLAANLPSGVYFYQLRAGSYVETKKMLLLK